MREGKHANALLLELLIVLLFFLLAVTTLTEVTAGTRTQERLTAIRTEAVPLAENVADSLYRTDQPEELLRSLGFEKTQEAWVLPQEGWTLRVTEEIRQTRNGKMIYWTVSAFTEAEEAVSLPVARYLQGEVGL